MDPEAAKGIMRSFLSNYQKCGFIQFFGGEPTLNLDGIEAAIEETLRMVDDGTLTHRPRFGIVTNGVLLNSERTINLLKKYSVEMTVSLDGPAFIHNALRPTTNGASTYDRVTETISTAKSAGIPVAIESVYTSHHIRESFSIVDLFKFCQELGVGKLIFDKTYPPSPPELNPLFDPYFETLLGNYQEAVDWWFQSLLKGEKNFLRFYFNDLLLSLIEGTCVSEEGCPAGTRQFAIVPEGEIFPCQLLYRYHPYSIGNALSGDYTGVTTSFPINIDDFDTCKVCFARYLCQPCAALNLYWGNALHTPDRECTLRKTVISRIGQWAFGRLQVPDNEITRVLRNAITGLS